MPTRTIRLARRGVVVLAVATLFTGCTEDVTPPEGESAQSTQAAAGTGWRLLGDEINAGEAYRTGIATTDEQLSQLVRASGLAIDVPEIDWDREIVVWFGMSWGTSCPLRLVDVIAEGGLLHGDFDIATTEATPTCNDDINPHSFLVAVDRSILPPGPFSIALTDYVTHNLAEQEVTVVEADLSIPGSTVDDPSSPAGTSR